MNPTSCSALAAVPSFSRTISLVSVPLYPKSTFLKTISKRLPPRDPNRTSSEEYERFPTRKTPAPLDDVFPPPENPGISWVLLTARSCSFSIRYVEQNCDVTPLLSFIPAKLIPRLGFNRAILTTSFAAVEVSIFSLYSTNRRKSGRSAGQLPPLLFLLFFPFPPLSTPFLELLPLLSPPPLAPVNVSGGISPSNFLCHTRMRPSRVSARATLLKIVDFMS
mmetsp:Transcript_24988/g.52517  ORF Transcript_24988/g.52517 Transcript_24988/m.52517 type:complete len:221 (-) Transcript_24988:848-1510(-)